MRTTVDGAIAAVRRYLDSDMAYPFFVAVENGTDTDRIIQSLGGARQMKLSDYCSSVCPDSFPEEDRMIDALYQEQSNVFIRGLGEYLTLWPHSLLLDCLFDKTFSHKTVVFGRNLSEKLERLQERESKFTSIRWLAVDSEPDFSVVGVHPSVKIPAHEDFRQLLHAVETGAPGKQYVRTNLTLENIPYIVSAWDAIWEYSDSFDVPENALSPEQWEEYLKDSHLDGETALHWRTFLRQKLRGAQSDYFRLVMDYSPDYAAYRRSIASAILRYEYSTPAFRTLYDERKELLRQYPDYDISEYLRDSRVRDKERIHYLTDNTKEERRAIIEELAHIREIPDDLPLIYPDLAAYLDEYRFETANCGELFTWYFERYKIQKVLNELAPDFLEKVEELSKPGERQYQRLPTRGMMMTRLKANGTGLHWLDALGVEYLGYIRKIAKKLELRIQIHIAQTSLPTITRLPSKGPYSAEERKHNGSFYDDWTGFKRPRDPALDDVKHDGVRPQTKSAAPAVHLADELEIIEKALRTIKSDLVERRSGVEKMLLVSDHGASRLCVLYQHENKWTMSEKGKYSGRCCPVGDADEPPDSATKESGFWVLANYDRFKGSRAAMVEVHGGASLEEVIIPLIEIELANQKIECYVPGFEDAETAVIEKPFDGKPMLPLYCSNAAARIRVRVKGREYAGAQDSQNGNLFHISLDGHWVTGIPHQAVAYDGDNELTSFRFVLRREKKSTMNDRDGTEFFAD